MSAGNAIILPSGGSAPTYRGAICTPIANGSPTSIGVNPAAVLNVLTVQNGAAPVGMTLSAGGLLVANAGLYRARGNLMVSDGSNFTHSGATNIVGSIVVAGVHVAFDPCRIIPRADAPSNAYVALEIDALISVTANQLVQLGANGSFATFFQGFRASLKVESMF